MSITIKHESNSYDPSHAALPILELIFQVQSSLATLLRRNPTDLEARGFLVETPQC